MGRKSVLILLFLFLGCVKDDEINKSYEKATEPIIAKKNAATTDFIFDGEREPEWPIDNDSTLMGVDSNKNNIRDDIEIYINHTEKNSDLRKALKQKYKYYYLIHQETYKNNKKKLWELEDKKSLAINCYDYLLFAHGEPYDKHENINNFFLNTYERLKLEKKRSYMLAGYSDDDGFSINESYKGCEFSIDENVISMYLKKIK